MSHMENRAAVSKRKRGFKLSFSFVWSKTKTKKAISILLSLIIFAFIFALSGYTPLTLTDDSFNQTLINVIFLAVNLVIFILLARFKHIFRELKAKHIPPSYIVLGILAFSTVLTLIATFDFGNIIAYAGHGVTILNAFLISYFFNFKTFIKTFCNLVFGLTVIGLVFYSFYMIGGVNISPLPNFYSWIGREYGNFFYLAYHTIGSNRFQGFAWEPGLMASFLLEAIIFELIFDEKVNKVHFVIFTIALICTLSTFAYIAYLLVVVIILERIIKKKKIFIGACVALGVALILCLVFYQPVVSFLATIMPQIFQKLVGSGSGSLTTRLYSPYIDLLIFMKSPLWGVGLTNFNTLYSEYIASAQFSMVDSQTSTTFSLMGQFGLLGIVPLVALFIGIDINDDISMFNKIMLMLMFILILNKEPHNGLLIDWCFIFVFLKESTERNEKSLIFGEPSEDSLLHSIRNRSAKRSEN